MGHWSNHNGPFVTGLLINSYVRHVTLLRVCPQLHTLHVYDFTRLGRCSTRYASDLVTCVMLVIFHWVRGQVGTLES